MIASVFWIVLQSLAFLALVAFLFYGFLLGGIWILRWWQRRHLRSGRCRVCGCTEDDCVECIIATGEACWWIDNARTLCSRCVDELEEADLDDLSPACSPLNARRRPEARMEDRG